jgi:ABC-type nickel/cobalt efflux system permease component RcnA
MCKDTENTSGMMMTGAIAILANIGTYFAFRRLKQSKKKHIKKEHDIAFSRFQTKSDQVNTYIRENQLFYNSSYNTETRQRGLIIIEAYYGLADHIYQIEGDLI